MAERFLVVPAEWVAGETYNDLQDALGAATMKTKSDRNPRAVIKVLAQIAPDPTPSVLVTRFDEDPAHA